MSGKLMGHVYECEFSHGQQAVLLAMADHAQDDGSNCFPAIGRVSWKTGYSERQVKRLIKELRTAKVLVEVAPAGRRHAVEYRIDLSAAQAKEPYVPRGDKRDTGEAARGDNGSGPGVTPEAVRGDTTTSPKPSKEPSRENNHVDLVHQHYVETFGKTGKAAELREDERRIIRNALAAANDVNELLTCITACEASDFHQKRAADADRKGSKYNSLGVIFKPRPRFNETQRSRIEWWLEMREEQEGGTAPTTPSPYDAKTEVAHV